MFFTVFKAELKSKCLYLLQNETSETFEKFEEDLFFIQLYICLTVKWINLISLFIYLFIYLFTCSYFHVFHEFPQILTSENPLGIIDNNVLNTQDGYSGFQEKVIKSPPGLTLLEIMLILTNYAKNYASTKHISHNSPCLSPKLCLQFLLGQLQYPVEMKNKAHAKLWVDNEVHYGRCANDCASIIFGIIRHYEHNFHVFPQKST